MNQKIETIKKVIVKYCEPKLYGMSAYEIATLVNQALEDGRREVNKQENKTCPSCGEIMTTICEDGENFENECYERCICGFEEV